ncbi:hypothetical protein P8605_11130 [Streptomyces sp. T-3]|nr:hypothetical protein [Streptomyces sp. T-3]
MEITAELADRVGSGDAFHNLHWQRKVEFSLDCFICFWWAPFHDERRGQAGCAPTRHPWVRLYAAHDCPDHDHERETFSIQTNLVRPVTRKCTHCGRTTASSS